MLPFWQFLYRNLPKCYCFSKINGNYCDKMLLFWYFLYRNLLKLADNVSAKKSGINCDKMLPFQHFLYINVPKLAANVSVKKKNGNYCDKMLLFWQKNPKLL